MKHTTTSLLGSLAALAVGVASVWAQQPADCAQIVGVDPKESYKQNPQDVHECMARGWDAPVSWRPNKGKSPGIRVGGAGGFSHGTIQAPDMPPWKAHGNSTGGSGSGGSGSGSSSSGGLGFPPWQGWPFSSSGGSGSGGSGSSSSSSGGGCPTSNDDNDATFGEKPPLTGSVSLTCGGAAPLTTYQLSLSSNADALFVTEHGYYNYWVYRKQGSTYQLISQANAMLPQQLCDGTLLQPPIAQMISFNSGSSSIAVRLKLPPDTNPLADPLDPPPQPPALPEKHLILPVSGGNVQVPANCANVNTYTTTNAVGDLVFDSILSGGCEAPANVCTEQNYAQTPSALPDCRLAVMYLTGSCSDKTQIILLDRPNLIYPPGSTATSVPIDGMSAVMLPTVAGSMIQTKDGWIVRMGTSNATYTFPQGAIVGLADGTRLAMGGPATLTNSGQATLTKGGSLMSRGGSVLATYPDNTVITVTPVRPIPLKINQSVNMPAGYMLPSSPSAKVRLPVTVE